MASNAPQATRYRACADLGRSPRSTIAATTPTAANCQTECNRHQPNRSTSSRPSPFTRTITARLPPVVVLESLDQPTDLRQLLRRRSSRRQRLHDQLQCRAAEGAPEQVADQMLLRLLLTPAGRVDVRPPRLVAHHQTLLGHDLEQL